MNQHIKILTSLIFMTIIIHSINTLDVTFYNRTGYDVWVKIFYQGDATGWIYGLRSYELLPAEDYDNFIEKNSHRKIKLPTRLLKSTITTGKLSRHVVANKDFFRDHETLFINFKNELDKARFNIEQSLLDRFEAFEIIALDDGRLEIRLSH